MKDKKNLFNRWKVTNIIESSPKILINDRIRKLTPLECERLQGFPDNWTGELSDTQRYKLIGNAFSVEVISYILKFLKKKPTSTRNIITLYDKVY